MKVSIIDLFPDFVLHRADLWSVRIENGRVYSGDRDAQQAEWLAGRKKFCRMFALHFFSFHIYLDIS